MRHREIPAATLLLALCVCAAAAAADDARLKQAWQSLDGNGDGVVAMEELHPMQAQAMMRHDADGNGRLSLQEYTAYDLDPGGAAQVPIPDNVKLHAGLPYADKQDPRQQLDIYLPANTGDRAPLPLLVYMHGGGWAIGSKVAARSQMLPLVSSGRFAAASIGYRLSWQATWPAQIHDVKAAVRWLRAHADEYGIDPGRFCAFGPSAGGHLAAMLGTTNGVEALEGTLGQYTNQASDVHCAVDFFGPTDLRKAPALNRLGKPSMVTRLLGVPAGDNPELAGSASPLAFVDEGDVPFLIVHGTGDTLVDYADSKALDAKLREAGVPSVLVTVEGGGHGDFGAAGPAVNRLVEQFLLQVFYDESSEVTATTLSAMP